MPGPQRAGLQPAAASLSPQRSRLQVGMGLMMASGFAALGCQLVWTQQVAVWLGHESAAVLGVVTAFFGGLGLGAWVLGPRILRSPQPLRWYLACELTIALWCLVLAAAMEPLGEGLLRLTGPLPAPAWQWTVAFVGTLLLLLPATTAMGGSLPAVERLLRSLHQGHTPVAGLYAANTAGAVAGVLAAAFWLVPQMGLLRTVLLCAALNLLCAVAARWAFAGQALATNTTSAHSTAPTSQADTPPPNGTVRPTPLAWTLACTGLLGIGYEVLVVRMLSQVAQNTVFTFAVLLAVYLVGTAAGAAWLHRRPLDAPSRQDLQGRLLLALAASVALGTLCLYFALHLQALLAQALGAGQARAVLVEALLALLVFGPATVLMGALFSLLAQQAATSKLGLGRALAVNTLGAAAAPLLFGVLLLPLLGARLALLLLAGAYLLLAGRVVQRLRSTGLLWGALLVMAVAAPPLTLVSLPPGGRLVSHTEGALAAVSVMEDSGGVRSLHIDNRQQEGSSATAYADGRQAWLPLLLHPSPRQVLFLGLGTGVTARTALNHPGVQVQTVELLPEVVAAAAGFAGPGAAASGLERLTQHVADARRFVRAGTQPFDVIVSDNFHPARSGSAALYTTQHFAAVRARLAPGGLFCQWLPLHQMDLQTLQSIVRSFQSVYPQTWAVLATNSLDTPVLGLIGPAQRPASAPAWSVQGVREHLNPDAFVHSPQAWGLGDTWSVLGSLVAGPQGLSRWAEGVPLNTDDHPVVAYLAPRATYAPQTTPRHRLMQLLDGLHIDDAELQTLAQEPADQQRLRAYWTARDLFLRAGTGVRASADVNDMLQQVRAPLLQALRISPDFRPAYDPLLQMAQALSGRDPAAARQLLLQLQQAQPNRPEAAGLLADWATQSPRRQP